LDFLRMLPSPGAFAFRTFLARVEGDSAGLKGLSRGAVFVVWDRIFVHVNLHSFSGFGICIKSWDFMLEEVNNCNKFFRLVHRRPTNLARNGPLLLAVVIARPLALMTVVLLLKLGRPG
jgi:hypothetical protein